MALNTWLEILGGLFFYWAVCGSALYLVTPGSDFADLVICFLVGWAVVPGRIVAKLL